MTNEQLVIRIRAGIDIADNMQTLYLQNEGFISKMAERYAGYAEREDLMQEGYIGMQNAVDGYDPEGGVLFLSYAGFWIRQAMQRYIHNCCRAVRFPVHMSLKVEQYEKTVKKFAGAYGRDPTDQEVKGLLGVTGKELAGIKKALMLSSIGSLDSPTEGQDGDTTLQDVAKDSADIEEDVLDRVQAEELRAVLWPIVDALPRQQSDMVHVKYAGNLTVKQAGERLGMDGRQARSVHDKALRTLRHPENERKLRPYYLCLPDSVHTLAYRKGLESFNRTWESATETAAFADMGVQ